MKSILFTLSYRQLKWIVFSNRLSIPLSPILPNSFKLGRGWEWTFSQIDANSKKALSHHFLSLQTWVYFAKMGLFPLFSATLIRQSSTKNKSYSHVLSSQTLLKWWGKVNATHFSFSQILHKQRKLLHSFCLLIFRKWRKRRTSQCLLASL